MSEFIMAWLASEPGTTCDAIAPRLITTSRGSLICHFEFRPVFAALWTHVEYSVAGSSPLRLPLNLPSYANVGDTISLKLTLGQ